MTPTQCLLLVVQYSCYQACTLVCVFGSMTILPQARQELNRKLEEVNAHLEHQVYDFCHT